MILGAQDNRKIGELHQVESRGVPASVLAFFVAPIPCGRGMLG